jgi:NTE family protein
MSIPFIFQAVKFNNDLFVDGGLLNNYPIWIFGRDNPNVLGLKLKQEDLVNVDRSINSFYDYSLQLLNSMFLEMEKNKIDDYYWDQTVCINIPLGISSSDFGIDRDKKEALIKSGYKAMSQKICYKNKINV